MALRLTRPARSSAILAEFIDQSYLNNKRPAVPGGAWTVELLRTKSFADLQQLWFTTIKERNMLSSTKHHYVVHQEELGAMPAPSRVKMVDETLHHIRLVMRERDFEATDRAVAIFKERLAAGVYRYPPGPQPPPSHGITTSTIQVTLSKKIDEPRLRDIFARHDVFEAHKGIAECHVQLPPETQAAKKAAESEWDKWRYATRKFEDYHAYDDIESIYDETSVELAPGLYDSDSGRAVDVPVPDPAPKRLTPPTGQMDLLRWKDTKGYIKKPILFNQFPHNTRDAPSEPGPRPTHPDEIEGPWKVKLVYDRPDGLDYVNGLNVTSIDGATVLEVTDVTDHEPYSRRCPVYSEALNTEKADQSTTHQFPHMPAWKSDYTTYTRKKLDDIIRHNYSNVVDYVDREVLMTGKSVYEMPIPIDYTCGGAINVPAHAHDNRDKRFAGMMDYKEI